jgi:hypothetical protein
MNNKVVPLYARDNQERLNDERKAGFRARLFVSLVGLRPSSFPRTFTAVILDHGVTVTLFARSVVAVARCKLAIA